MAKIIEIHTGETGENFGFAGIECVGVNGARGGKNAVQHVEKISGSIGFHVGAEPEKTALLQQETEMKIGFTFFHYINDLNGTGDEGEKREIGFGFFYGLTEDFG